MVDKIDASAIEDFYGLTSDIQKSSETGYLLFYQSRDAEKWEISKQTNNNNTDESKWYFNLLEKKIIRQENKQHTQDYECVSSWSQ